MFDRNLFALEGMGAAFAVSALCSFMRGLLVIVQCFTLAFAIVSVWDGATIGSAMPYLAVFAVCFLARQLVKGLNERFMERYAAARMEAMRRDLADGLWRTTDTLPSKEGTATIATMMVSEISSIGSYLQTIVPKTVAVIVIPLCIAVAAFTQDWVSGLIVTVCYPFIIVFMRLIGHTASDESAKRLKGFAVMSSNFLDALRGMGTLQAFKISKAYSKNVYAASESYRSMVMRTLRIATLSSTVLDIFATCGLAAVAIMLGFRMVEGSIAFLPALTVLMLVPEFFMPVKAYASDYHATLDGKSALESLFEMLRGERREVALPEGGVGIGAGERVAIIGRTGSGKSSLLAAVAGVAGHGDVGLTIGGAAPSDDPAWLERVALIPQRPHLVDGTLRENVAFYAPDADDDAIVAALEAAGLGDLLSGMPAGLDTPMGVDGRGVSAGQAQRISIARALVDGSRDIWLLDEPGANLDIWTDRELKDAVFEAAGKRTIVVATHRMHWAEGVDRIIDLDAIGCRSRACEGGVRECAASSEERGRHD